LDPKDEFTRELVKEVEKERERIRKELEHESESLNPKEREHLEEISRFLKDHEQQQEVQNMVERVKKIQGQREPDNALKKRLRGPSGVVFVEKRTAQEGMIDGQVVAGSRAIVLADDQGGKENRGVLILLLRDPALGVDPGVEVVVCAANLVKDSSRSRPP
jgi:hypothetical protein